MRTDFDIDEDAGTNEKQVDSLFSALGGGSKSRANDEGFGWWDSPRIRYVIALHTTTTADTANTANTSTILVHPQLNLKKLERVKIMIQTVPK